MGVSGDGSLGESGGTVLFDSLLFRCFIPFDYRKRESKRTVPPDSPREPSPLTPIYSPLIYTSFAASVLSFGSFGTLSPLISMIGEAFPSI